MAPLSCNFCKDFNFCSYCAPGSSYFRPTEAVKSGCSTCRVRDQKRFKDLYEMVGQLETKITVLVDHISGLQETIAMQKTKLKSLKLKKRDLSLTVSRQKSDLTFLKLEPPTKPLTGDVVIIMHQCGQRVQAHRFILSQKSPVFNKMFDTEMLEMKTGLININDTNFLVMRAVIDYCYTAEITFNKEVCPEEVIQVAHKYAIALLFNVCEEELIKRIDADNLPEMLKLSNRFEAKRLQAALEPRDSERN